MKDIVHIMPDDKFIDDFIRMSEKFNHQKSSYIILTLQDPKFVKSENQEVSIIKVNSNFELNDEVLHQLNQCKVIILHSFDWKYWAFIEKLSKEIKIIWSFWGIDGYNAIRKSKYLTKESTMMQYDRSAKGIFKSYVRLVFNYFLLPKQKACRNIIRRADYCATFVKDDLELVKRINPNIEGLYFTYFNETGYNLLELSEPNIDGEVNILLGNSANPTNEHSLALSYLDKINFKGKIYCPLSYSGTEVYINNVIKLGTRLFGDKFIPLTEFLNYKEYSRIISDCDIVFMNHIRQQAVGNIFKSISLLKPVILNNKSYLRSTFLDWGLKIYDLDILSNINLINIDDLKKNREIILRILDENNNLNFFNKIAEISNSEI